MKILKKVLYILKIVFFTLFLFNNVCASEISSISIIDYGVTKSTIIDKSSAEMTIAGTIKMTKNPSVIKHTNKIPAKIGSSFGVIYIINGDIKNIIVPIDIQVSHPPMVNPKTKKIITTQKLQLKHSIGQEHHFSFTFDNEYELAAIGKWIFQFSHNGKLIAEQPFDIIKH